MVLCVDPTSFIREFQPILLYYYWWAWLHISLSFPTVSYLQKKKNILFVFEALFSMKKPIK